MVGEIKPDDLYRKCPEPKCHYGTISEYEQGPNATHTSRCWTCNGIGFVPAAPAPTDALRAAAQALIDEYDKRNCYAIRDANVNQRVWETEISNLRTALRTALDGVSAPVALTDAAQVIVAGEPVTCLDCRWLGGQVVRRHGLTGGCMKTGLTVHGAWGCMDWERKP